ncbi:alpha/beta hydrolase [Microbulbifer bruguierae]|uniref:Alpha/beta hydrolase n=1 Tax=Microbulbifer bruguierae TaxID=3029061 RepID=A0ABY8NIW9_9GAMM|nr:alpha/beta hydrolase [Microbulbifer bruguierae]WGL17672.1 alpha/beta hydrolase [Microbulbifer bruguierae]
MFEFDEHKIAPAGLRWKLLVHWGALPVITLLVVLLVLPSISRTGAQVPLVADAISAEGSLSAEGSSPAEGSFPVDATFPVDDSFNIDAAFAKARKEYPDITVAKVAAAAELVVKRDVVYRQLGDRELHLDLFYPRPGAEQDLRPAVLLVHGGGWRSGNRTLQEPLATYLANRGFVAATVEYRLSLEARYPAGVQDVKAALGWLRDHAGEYGMDPRRVAIVGASSGAQMATLVGVTPGLDVFETAASAGKDSVQAIVNLDGVVSFTTPMALKYENDPRKNPSAAGAWFGGRFEDVPALWREASPLEYAGAGSPPTLFINSSRPRFHAGRDEYIERLAAAGIFSEVMTHDDSPHPYWLFEPWFSPSAEKATEFLQRTLERAREQT